MRLLWAAAYYGTHRGSFVPLMERTADLARARGDDFIIVLPDLGAMPWHDGLRSRGAQVRFVRPNDARAAAAAVLAERPDVVHAHFDGWLVTVTAALAASRARVLWHLHSTFEPDGGPLRFTWKRAVKFRVIGRRVERFVTVSRTLAAETERMGVPPARIIVLPNAIDRARFHPPSAAERDEAKRRLGLDPARKAIAFFGRDPRIKGADVLAAALEGVDADVIAVATPAPAVEQLRCAAHVLDVPFLDDVRQALWAADAIAIPSRGEGMPYVALEALACHVPVVASALPWARELAADRSGIRIAAPESAPALRSALTATFAERERFDDATPDLGAWATAMYGLYTSPPLAPSASAASGA